MLFTVCVVKEINYIYRNITPNNFYVLIGGVVNNVTDIFDFTRFVSTIVYMIPFYCDTFFLNIVYSYISECLVSRAVVQWGVSYYLEIRSSRVNRDTRLQ